MKREKGLFNKRNARANVIIDEDDYNILKIVNSGTGGIFLDPLKEQMNISHKSLLVHLNRLAKHGWIKIFRAMDEQYKFKIVETTSEGKKVLENIENAKSFSYLKYQPKI